MNNPEFRVHMLNANGVRKAIEIRDVFDQALDKLAVLCTPDGTIGPGGREYSIVKTKLEEACFFAKKSIANQECNQLQDEGGKL
jgi:hypothetical protein